ncbi:hypothetical protein ACHQM5_027365 [Ranunculus cassubicifolius]
MADESTYCADCKKTTQVTYDHCAGDTICLECGLVLEAYCIDDTSEWRTFSVDCNSAADNDPNRVGYASNPLLDHTHLSTFISQTPKSSNSGLVVPRWQTSVCSKNPDKNIIEGFEGIATMSERLSLVSTIKDRANEIFKNVEDHKIMKVTKKNLDTVYAACLFIACEEEHKPRTFKEFLTVANGATKREISHAKYLIEKDRKKEMGEQMEVGVGGTHATDFVERFCRLLGLKFQTIKAAKDAAMKLEELDIRRSPISLAAAVIYMLTQLSRDEKRPLQEIADATKVAVNTIKNSYKDVHPYASSLIPSYYAQENGLNILTAA